MSYEPSTRKGWFQSQVILGTARRIYLVMAALCLLVVVAGLAFAAFFQVVISSPSGGAPVPDVTMNVADVARHLQPPTNLRFVVTRGFISEPIGEQEVLGYFDADTANGLARFPDDFDILGGRDAGLFDRIPVSINGAPRAGLRPTTTLVDQINRNLRTASSQRGRNFSLRIASRDASGSTSPATDVTFVLSYGPKAAGTVAAAPALTDLQRVARDIAIALDPRRSPAYFDAYERALRTPGRCGARDTDAGFVSGYRKAFDTLRQRINSANVEVFYAAVCDAWRIANASRNEAMARNLAAEVEADLKSYGASIGRTWALGLVGGALIVFLIVSLSLAFLAIEDHSRSMKLALEVLARTKGES